MNSIKNRCFSLFILFLIIFTTLFLWGLVPNQILHSEELKSMANAQYDYKEKMEDLNYLLLDSNGRNLLQYRYKYFVVVDPGAFKLVNENLNTDSKAKEERDRLKYILKNYKADYDLDKVATAQNRNKLYFEIDRLTYEKVSKIESVNGIYSFYTSNVDRSGPWSIENLITTETRTKDDTLKSSDSIERTILEGLKQNKPMQIIFDKDVDGKVLSKSFATSDSNTNLMLTLDKNIQNRIKDVLLKNEYSKFSQIGVILMESSTGKIKGMVLKDDNKPNVNLGSELMGFQPGSIFKVLVEEAALENKKITLDEEFTCKEGKDSLCKKSHGTIKVSDAFSLSCNNVFAEIGNRVGYDSFIKLAKQQGFFDKVLGFDSEAKGSVEKFSQAEGGASRFSIGQSMVITPVQAVSVVNTVVNGGVYVKPRLIEGYVDQNDKILQSFKDERATVVKKANADIIKRQMQQVVKEGTGKAAYMNGIEIGGKTGTNERLETVKNDDKDATIKHSDGWFIGYFKNNNKYYSMVVFVMDIDVKSEGGGSTAAPIFKDVVNSVKDKL